MDRLELVDNLPENLLVCTDYDEYFVVVCGLFLVQ